MIYVNVAPEISRHFDTNALVKQLMIALVILGIAYYIPIIQADSKNAEAEKVRAESTKIKDELKNLQMDLGKAKDLNLRLGQLKEREERIKKLNTGRKQPVLALDKLQQIHIDRIWFDSIVLEKNKIVITGWAVDHGSISEYVHRLKAVESDEAGTVDLDVNTFNPRFREILASTDKMKIMDSLAIVPLKFSGVTIKGATLEEKSGTALQKFELELTANVDPSLAGGLNAP